MVLVGMLSGLTGLLKIKNASDIDTAVFKLHYKITAAFLFAFCLLVTAKGLVGDPINCIYGNNPRLQKDVVNTYCWIHTTFTLPKHLHKKMGGNTAVLYPGVGTDEAEDERTYHAYYQWVPFVLFLQGLMFYAPHWLWSAWEGGKINAMVMGLSNPVMNREEKREKIKLLADYLFSSLHLHNVYAAKFIICEGLNLLNGLGTFWFLDKFLGGMFLNFGVEVSNYLQTDDENRTDPLIVLFPRITKCTFHMFGYSGSIEKHDLMCVLALNVINEKIYVFLWFWFVILVVISSLAMIYRFLVLCLPSIRVGLLHKRAKPRFNDFVKTMTKKLQIGDCFVLHLLSKNMDFLAFTSLLEELYLNMNSNESQIDIELAQHLIAKKS